MQTSAELATGDRLSRFLDYFIPAELRVSSETHRRARMFMLSHVFGPILGNTLPLYMVVTNIARDFRVSVFFFSILLFWAYPFVLRRTKRYQLLAFLSVQNLIFCALWACYAFGGSSSPFLPWILIFPLLAFLYLPPKGWIRNVLLVQIFGSVALFFGMDFSGHPFPPVRLEQLQVIGMISMASVATYFAMMSLYFAKMFHEQREFTRQLNALVSTSDNLRNLTVAANQASAAKADFVAGMSHELRTPLNAIIGYSQLLLEEARDEEDEATVKDLSHVHKAGTDLLRLIDDILDLSRIDAGKMPINPATDMVRHRLPRWVDVASALLAAPSRTVTLLPGSADASALHTDWTAAESVVRHLIAGIVSQRAEGDLTLWADDSANGTIIFTLVDTDAFGAARPVVITQEMFEHDGDVSSTKYGSTGIEIALSFKFAGLLGGTIRSVVLIDGRPATQITLPNLVAPEQLAA